MNVKGRPGPKSSQVNRPWPVFWLYRDRSGDAQVKSCPLSGGGPLLVRNLGIWLQRLPGT